MTNKLETIPNLFEGKEIRSIWDRNKEDYYFSIVDVISALTNANIPRNYWSDLKRKKSEGSQLHENIVQLKMKAQDGKMRETDILDTKGILRLIESVPSPKAEPFKLWLANLGSERIDEVFDPEIAINRAVNYYRNKGYSDEWIKNRLNGIVDRFKLTDIWKDGGITKPFEYAMLTNEIYKGWSGMKASEYKVYYFETMYGDDDVYELDENNEIIKDKDGKPIIVKKGFRKNGVSKENSKGPIVQMGLFIDNNGIPVSHKLFPGNTQDKTTFKNVLENDVDEMDLGRIVIVADNGMNTQENKYLIVDKDNGYIVSKSVKRSWTSQREWALDDNGYNCIKNSSNEIVFKYKSRVNEITLTYKNEDGTKSKKKVKEKEIIYWSKKHYEKEVHQNKKFIEYLESCKDNPDKLKDKQRKSQEFIKVLDIDKKTGEVIKTDKLIVFLDKKLERYKETLGYYSIVTSEIEEDDKEIINRYHGLSRIEDSFRVIKSDLEGRPIYVWTEEHIKAHFLICFIALTIIRIIQHKILKYENKSTLNVDGWEQGITAETLKNELNKFEADKFDENSYKLRKPTDNIINLLKIYQLDNFNFLLPNQKEIIELRNSILKKEI